MHLTMMSMEKICRDFFLFLNRTAILFFPFGLRSCDGKNCIVDEWLWRWNEGGVLRLSVNASCLNCVTQLSVCCQFEIILFYILFQRFFSCEEVEKNTHTEVNGKRVYSFVGRHRFDSLMDSKVFYTAKTSKCQSEAKKRQKSGV